MTDLLAAADPEAVLLGTLLTWADGVPEACKLLSPEDFGDKRHQEIFRTLGALHNVRKVPDVTSIIATLTEGKRIGLAGGRDYVITLASSAGLADPTQYVEMVLEASKRRASYQTAKTFAQAVAAGGDLTELLEQAARDFGTIASKGVPSVDRDDFHHHAADTLDALWRQKAADSHVLGVDTGIPEFNRRLPGWAKGVYHVIGARPSVGKSALAWQQAVQAAKGGAGVIFFSLEMAADQLVRRFLASELPHNLSSIMGAYLTDDEMDRVVDAFADAPKWRLKVPCRASMTISDLRRYAARSAEAMGGCDLLIVDYLQLIAPDRHGNRNEELTQISAGLNALKHDLGCAVVALSQLSRNCEQERRAPNLSDLRDSGSIEQDADVVLFLHHPWWDKQYPTTLRDVIIAKYRNGRRSKFKLYWQGEYQKFSGLENDRGEDDD